MTTKMHNLIFTWKKKKDGFLLKLDKELPKLCYSKKVNKFAWNST